MKTMPRTLPVLALALLLCACSLFGKGIDRTLPWDKPPTDVTAAYREAIGEAGPEQQKILGPLQEKPVLAALALKTRYDALLKDAIPQLTGDARIAESARLDAEYKKVQKLNVGQLAAWYLDTAAHDQRRAIAAVESFLDDTALVVTIANKDRFFVRQGKELTLPDPTDTRHVYPVHLEIQIRNNTPHEVILGELTAQAFVNGAPLAFQCDFQGGRSMRHMRPHDTTMQRFVCISATNRAYEEPFLYDKLSQVSWKIGIKEGHIALYGSDVVHPVDTAWLGEHKELLRQTEASLATVQGWLRK